MAREVVMRRVVVDGGEQHARIVNSSHLNSSEMSFTPGFHSIFKSSTSDLK
jgi:hypothetical protein